MSSFFTFINLSFNMGLAQEEIVMCLRNIDVITIVLSTLLQHLRTFLYFL